MPNEPVEQQETKYDRNDLYLYTLRKMAESNLDNNLTNLTKLLNKRAFFYKTAEFMQENKDKNFAVLIYDISNFKLINEFCSHEMGDEVIKYIADIFRDYWEHKELTCVSHFRADIFAMFTPFRTKDELISLSMEIHQKVDAFRLPFKILGSIGICVAVSPEMPTSNMCDYAAMALQTIKGKFFAKYAFFDESMFDQLRVEKQIENEIVEALADGQLQAFIQPKVDMRTGEIVGGEALVRWIHPEHGVISPGRFIPVLEKNGLIIDVDYCIWTQVFKWISDRRKAKKKVVPISINISRMHAYDSIFQKRLIQLMQGYKVPSSLVLLELTESSFLTNTDGMYSSMLSLKEEGFTLSMDDFGTGYSTMTMLKNQPVDEVKVDKGFIDDIENENAQIILDSMIQMLKRLNKKIIVEGVETTAQQDFLIDHGCFTAQGFLYYKPMPIKEFEALLDQADTPPQT